MAEGLTTLMQVIGIAMAIILVLGLIWYFWGSKASGIVWFNFNDAAKDSVPLLMCASERLLRRYFRLNQ